jgi:hypothetical protein
MSTLRRGSRLREYELTDRAPETRGHVPTEFFCRFLDGLQIAEIELEKEGGLRYLLLQLKDRRVGLAFISSRDVDLSVLQQQRLRVRRLH